MDGNVTPLLGMGIMAVAAISLLNAASTGIHALELDKTGKTGKVFVFRSERAQDLRRSFRRFPQAIAWTYILFVLIIVVFKLSSDLDPDFRKAFMQSAMICYALGIVTWMAKQSREVFMVIQDPARTSGS